MEFVLQTLQSAYQIKSRHSIKAAGVERKTELNYQQAAVELDALPGDCRRQIRTIRGRLCQQITQGSVDRVEILNNVVKVIPKNSSPSAPEYSDLSFGESRVAQQANLARVQ
jgi:hypothetical protein